MSRVELPESPTPTCAVLAELGLTMEGSVSRALLMASAAAEAGAWGIKVQLLRPEHLAAPAAPTYWDDERGHGDQRTSFAAASPPAYDDFGGLREHCRGLGLAFVATPFDDEAVVACIDLDVDAIKVASGDLTNGPLLAAASAAAAELGCPLLLSTGAATRAEVEEAAESLAELSARQVVALACSLQYPTPSSRANLARIGELRSVADWRVGYSDHTPHAWTSLAAAAAGACLLEKHVTDGAAHDVPDNDFALLVRSDAESSDDDTRPALDTYVANAEEGARLRGSSELAPHEGEGPARVGARRSLYWTQSLDAGSLVRHQAVAALRPHDPAALQPGDAEQARGARTTRDVLVGSPVLADDFS